jgi:hypothetical protein
MRCLLQIRAYLNIGSLPKKVTNVMKEMAKTINAIFAMTPILKSRAKRSEVSFQSLVLFASKVRLPTPSS